jgi:hypothetical protein
MTRIKALQHCHGNGYFHSNRGCLSDGHHLSNQAKYQLMTAAWHDIIEAIVTISLRL